MRNTPCECPAAGWCERHHCMKPDYLFQRCRRDQTLFQAWEEGRGPCFPISDDENGEAPSTSTEIPSFARRVLNFGAATLRHAANGFREVDDTLQEARLTICRACSSCDTEQMICRELNCGCYLQTKSKWASETCPRGFWEPGLPKPLNQETVNTS